MAKQAGSDCLALEQQTGFLLQMAHHHARQAFNDALESLNIQAKHLGVLMALCSGRSFNQRQIGTKLGLDKSSVVLMVDDLERLRLVKRETDSNDRRAHILRITEEGRHRLGEARKIAEQVSRIIFAGFSQTERKGLERALRRVITNCGLDKRSEKP